MITVIRIILTVLSLVPVMILLGLMKLAIGGGMLYGLLSVLVTFGIPYATWTLTGRLKPVRSSSSHPPAPL